MTEDIYLDLYTHLNTISSGTVFNGTLPDNFNRSELVAVYTLETIISDNTLDRVNHFAELLLRVNVMNRNKRAVVAECDIIRAGLLAYTSLYIRDIQYDGDIPAWDDELEVHVITLRFTVQVSLEGIEYTK